jgi:hypothetical protein
VQSSTQEENDSKREEIAPVYTPELIISTSRSHTDAKYVIGKMISHGVNSSTFGKISQSMADKYGNFQYFCINASEDEIASVLMLVS